MDEDCRCQPLASWDRQVFAAAAARAGRTAGDDRPGLVQPGT